MRFGCFTTTSSKDFDFQDKSLVDISQLDIDYSTYCNVYIEGVSCDFSADNDDYSSLNDSSLIMTDKSNEDYIIVLDKQIKSETDESSLFKDSYFDFQDNSLINVGKPMAIMMLIRIFTLMVSRVILVQIARIIFI